MLFFILSLLGNATYGAGVSDISTSVHSLLIACIDLVPLDREGICHQESAMVRTDYDINLYRFLTESRLIGSIGTMAEDAIIFLQFHAFKANRSEAVQNV